MHTLWPNIVMIPIWSGAGDRKAARHAFEPHFYCGEFKYAADFNHDEASSEFIYCSIVSQYMHDVTAKVITSQRRS